MAYFTDAIIDRAMHISHSGNPSNDSQLRLTNDRQQFTRKAPK